MTIADLPVEAPNDDWKEEYALPTDVQRVRSAYLAKPDPELDDDMMFGGDRKARFWHGYWRKPDGWITTAPTYGDDYRMAVETGWQHLRQYGRFVTVNPNEPGGAWRVGQDPFRRILAMGGAGEFCLEQIVEHQWHRTPPMVRMQDGSIRKIRFPQLDGKDIPDFECKQCRPPRHFHEKVLLEKHESIMHSATSQNQSLARAMAQAGKEQSGPIVDVVKLLVSSQREMEQRQAAMEERFMRVMERLAGPIAVELPKQAAPVAASEPAEAPEKPAGGTRDRNGHFAPKGAASPAKGA